MEVNSDNGINIKLFCFPITLRCNLKCKLCGAYSPYYTKPYHPTLEWLSQQIKDLFEIVNIIEKFDIGGGEPFLRVDLPQIMQMLYKYRHRIEHIRLITNGTLMPPNGFIQEWVRWGGEIIIDKYPVKLDQSESIAAYLIENEINCEVRDYANNLHCGGWVDFGDYTLKHSAMEGIKMFEKCSVPRQGYFTSICDGNLFPCGRARILFEKGIGKDYVAISNSILSTEQKKEQILELLGGRALETCRYCNGMCSDSIRFIPAEQLE